jgi:hypothetical protein
MRSSQILLGLALGAAFGVFLPGQTAAEAAVHQQLSSSAACAPCHATDAQSRWETHRNRPCTALCLTCHAKEQMAKHHPVGLTVAKQPRVALRLTQDLRSACFTCHELSNRRFDAVRWKAESLFGRLFRKEARFKTYFLTVRNDRGQLCLACH